VLQVNTINVSAVIFLPGFVDCFFTVQFASNKTTVSCSSCDPN
jgi:hypothetical protein